MLNQADQMSITVEDEHTHTLGAMSAVEHESHAWDSSSVSSVRQEKSIHLKGRGWTILRFLLSVVFLLPIPLVALLPSVPHYAPQVTIVDNANVVHAESLKEELRQVEFTQETHLVILTFPAVEENNLNLTTLNFARSSSLQPPLIDPNNPQFWADGTLILSLAPYDRLIGTYFGEDIKIPLDDQERIQNDMKEELRAAQWAPAFVTGARSAAYQMSTDITDSPLPWFGAALAASISLGNLGALVARRRKTMSNFQAARDHYAQVTADYDTTMVEAGTISTESLYGAQMLEQYNDFQRRYHELTRSFQDFGTPSFLSSMRPAVTKRAVALHDEAQNLDNIDDSIANLASLLNLTSRWTQVWDNELGPVLEDMEGLSDLHRNTASDISQTIHSDVRDRMMALHSKILALRELIATAAMTPTEALDALGRYHEEIFSLSRRLLQAAADKTREKGGDVTDQDIDDLYREERGEYEGCWRYSGNRGTYNPHSTIRANSQPYAGGSSQSFVPGMGALNGVVVGYATSNISPSYFAQQQETHSSSGFSSGGMSGGGFSGAGSSSSF